MPNPRAKVWIVDDSPLDVEQARRALAANYVVEAFADGSAALERLAAGAGPDVIVCDWVMPGITGIELCRYLRASASLPQVGLLLLTARHATEQIVEGLAAGADDYVAKPYVAEELLARVTALVRARELVAQAAESQSDLRSLIESSPDPLLSVDAQGRVRTVNVAAEQALGRPAAELHGQPLESVLPELTYDRVHGGVPIADVAVGSRFYEPFVRIGTGGGLTVSLRDVTERRRAETERLDLYAIIAHDMRSPLHALLMRVELLLRGRRGPLAADLIGDLQRIDSGMRSLVAMINDFLELAKLDVRNVKAARRLDLRDVLAGTLEELKPLAEAGGLSLSLEAPGPAPVLGDARQLARVFGNLVGNAIKFTPAGGQVRTTVALDGPRVEASVIDTGPGIPKEALPTIFNRFTRVSGMETVVGSGLGLMIVREIVDAHGGSVTVQSEVGRGSTFSVQLPALIALESARP